MSRWPSNSRGALADALAKRSPRDFALGDALTVKDLRKDPSLVLELIEAFQEGRPGAAELLVEVYTPFINGCIRRYMHHFERDSDDLRQEGSLAVLDACSRWDFSRGITSPANYVFKYVQGYIKRYSICAEPCVRMPVHAYDRKDPQRTFHFGRKRKDGDAVREFRKTLSFAPICRLRSEFEEPRANGLPELKGLGVVASDESGDLFFLPFDLVDADAETAEEILANHDIISSLSRVSISIKALLDDRCRGVLDRRFAAGVGETLLEIGDSYGVTREWIRQLEMKALNACRDRAIGMRCRPSLVAGFEAWLVALVERVRATDRERAGDSDNGPPFTSGAVEVLNPIESHGISIAVG